MIIVSACLAGVECRYNGLAVTIPEIMEMVRKGEALAICPEVLAKMPIPRPSVEKRNGRIVTMEGKDLTEEYQSGAQIALKIALLVGCKRAILKAKSPTCGSGCIYDGTFSGKLVEGDGLFSLLLKENNIEVCTEDELLEAET